jgi:hypothetical protein
MSTTRALKKAPSWFNHLQPAGLVDNMISE